MMETQLEFEKYEAEKESLFRKLQAKGIVQTAFDEGDSFIGFRDRSGAIFPDKEEIYKWYSGIY